MYLYRVVMRNLVAPLAASEVIKSRLEFQAELIIENQSIVESSFTYLTCLLFLALYAVFSAT